MILHVPALAQRLDCAEFSGAEAAALQTRHAISGTLTMRNRRIWSNEFQARPPC